MKQTGVQPNKCLHRNQERVRCCEPGRGQGCGHRDLAGGSPRGRRQIPAGWPSVAPASPRHSGATRQAGLAQPPQAGTATGNAPLLPLSPQNTTENSPAGKPTVEHEQLFKRCPRGAPHCSAPRDGCDGRQLVALPAVSPVGCPLPGPALPTASAVPHTAAVSSSW